MTSASPNVARPRGFGAPNTAAALPRDRRGSARAEAATDVLVAGDEARAASAVLLPPARPARRRRFDLRDRSVLR
jgi:hypothetical protein